MSYLLEDRGKFIAVAAAPLAAARHWPLAAEVRRALERGELKDDALIRHPQLLAAPGIMSIVWGGLFERFEPLDVRSLMRAHFEIMFGKENAP